MSLDRLPIKAHPASFHNADEPHFIEPDNPWLFRYQSPLIASTGTSPLPSPTASPTSQGNKGKISPAATPTSPSSRGISQSPGSYFCQLCGKKFNSDKTFSAHLSSASHQSRIKQTSRAASQSKSGSTSSVSNRSKPQAVTQKSPSKLSRQSSSSFEYGEDEADDSDDSDDDADDSDQTGEESDDNSSSDDDSELTEDEEELASALLMVQSAAKLAQKSSAVTSTDLDKAYKLYLQAAKIYNKHWRVRDSSKAFCAVLDIQKQLLAAKRAQSATPVQTTGRSTGAGPASPSRMRSAQQLSSAPVSLLDISKSSTDTGKMDPTLLPHVMVLLKVTLYVGRLLRGFQPLQAQEYFQSTLDYIVSSASIASVGVDCHYQTPSPASLAQGTNAVLSLLEPIISFVDSQRAASPQPQAQPAVPFGKELQSIIAESVTYIAALDTATPRGLSRSLFFLALSNALGSKYGYSSTSQSGEWHLRMQAQLYANTPALWWSSDCWLQLASSVSSSASASTRVLFKEFALTAALLCDDLVRVKRALARCETEADEEPPLLSLICRFCQNKLDGNPLFFEQSRLEWPITRAELLRQLAALDGSSERFLFASARDGTLALLEEYLNSTCKAA